MKLYLINLYGAFMASELGVFATRNKPVNTMYYKHEILAECDVELPDGFEELSAGIYFGNEDAEIVTEKIGGKYVTSLVTARGVKRIKTWDI